MATDGGRTHGVTVTLSRSFLKFTGGIDKMVIEGTHDAIPELVRRVVGLFPALQRRLYTAEGQLRDTITVVVHDDEVAIMGDGQDALPSGQVVTLHPDTAPSEPYTP